MCQGETCTDADNADADADANDDDGQFMIVKGSLADKPNEPKNSHITKSLFLFLHYCYIRLHPCRFPHTQHELESSQSR